MKKVTKEILDKITFSVNNHCQGEAGTPSERFLGRAPKTSLPDSVKRFINHTELIEKRTEFFKIYLKFFRSSSKVLPKSFHSSFTVLSKFFQSSFKVLSKFFQSYFKVLLNFLQSSFKVFYSSLKFLTKYAQSSLKILSKFCQSSLSLNVRKVNPSNNH